MMLLTTPLVPPSWAAMLPQKFSAATTASLPAAEPVEATVVPQAAGRSNSAVAVSARSPDRTTPETISREWDPVSFYLTRPGRGDRRPGGRVVSGAWLKLR